MNSMIAVSAREVQKTYSGNRIGLEATTLELHYGQFVGLVGPNGAGKSTFIHLVSGVLQPTNGMVAVHVADRRRQAWVSQMTSVDWYLSVYDNILLGARLGGLGGVEAHHEVDQQLQQFDLEHARTVRPEQLSGGQQRRLQVARALAQRPDVVILDEPTTGLDPVAGYRVMEALSKLSQRGALVIVASHELSLLDDVATDILWIAHGKVSREQQPQIRRTSVLLSYQGVLQQEFVNELRKKGVSVGGISPLELSFDGKESLHHVLSLVMNNVTITKIEAREDSLHDRYLAKHT